MRRRNIEKALPGCIHCQSEMAITSITIGDIEARAWKCVKCGEEIIHPEDAQLALIQSKLKKGIKVKVGLLNKAPYVRFPKEFGSLVHKGDEVSIFLEGPDEIKLKVRHVSCA